MHHHRRAGRGSRLVGLTLIALASALAGCSPAPNEKVFFIEPTDGAIVRSPVAVEMGVENFIVEPAEDGVAAGRGHLHVIIDRPCVENRLTVPADDQHLHFGLGQTSTLLDLPPGEHFLCLQAADGSHTALKAVDEITITVIAE